MKLMNFGKEQELGIELIDKQHKEIIKTINHLYEIKDQDRKELINVFSSLIEQLKIHFNSEEKLMLDNKVVHYISHKLEHDRAFLKYSNYFKLFKSSKLEFDPEILISMKNWIESHLEKKDSKLKALALTT